MTNKKKNIGNVLLMLFMLFFPITGILLFWNDAHGKIRKSALGYYELSSTDVFTDWEFESWEEDASANLKDSIQDGHFDRIEGKFGLVKSLGKPEILNSYAKEIDDRTVQFVEMKIPTQFEKMEGELHLTVKKFTVAPRWRYDEVSAFAVGEK